MIFFLLFFLKIHGLKGSQMYIKTQLPTFGAGVYMVPKYYPTDHLAVSEGEMYFPAEMKPLLAHSGGDQLAPHTVQCDGGKVPRAQPDKSVM